MPHWKVVENLNLIAQDVIPRMRTAAARTAASPPNSRQQQTRGGMLHGPPGPFRAGFDRQVLTVNGVKTVV